MNHDDYIDRRERTFRNVTTYEAYHRALEYGGDRGQLPEAKLTIFELNDSPPKIEVRVLVNAVDVDIVPDLVERVIRQYRDDQ